jgi:hypothetical protein
MSSCRRNVAADQRGIPLAGDRLPHQLGNVENEVGLRLRGIGSTDLTNADADDVVEAPVWLGLGQVEDGADDLASTDGIGASVAVPLEEDRRAIVGLDRRPEVGSEGSALTVAKREVRTSEAAADRALATAFGEVQVLFPASFEGDRPALWVGEPNPVEGLESHGLPPLEQRVRGSDNRADLPSRKCCSTADVRQVGVARGRGACPAAQVTFTNAERLRHMSPRGPSQPSMRRLTVVMALLALGFGVLASRTTWIPFWITNDVTSVLMDWQRAGLSCGEPSVGMPGPMADWGCAGEFEGVTLHAGLYADAQGVFEIYAGVPAGTSGAETAGAFVSLLRATSLVRAAEPEMAAWLTSSNAAEGVMPVTSTTGILSAHVYRGSEHPELFVVPVGSSMLLAE